MLICERCGEGFHADYYKIPIADILKDAWYCKECLVINS